MKKKMTIIFKIKEGTRRRGQTNFGTHSIGEFVIVAKFGDHLLCRLASNLLNVIRQVGRQMKIPVKVTHLDFSIWQMVTI